MPIIKSTVLTCREKTMKLIKRLFFTAAAFCVFAASGSVWATSFNGYAGMKGDLKSAEDSDYFDPIMNLTGFFKGQFNFSDSLFFNTEVSISTGDVIDTKLTDDTEAVFCFDELSLTYRKNFLGKTQFFSIFKGNFCSLGSNQFLTQQFGIAPVTSMLTESFFGNKAASPCQINGLGFSYALRLNSKPVSFAGYVYKNYENESGMKQYNFDFRLAAVNRFLTVDFLAGFGAPSKEQKDGSDVFLLIDEIYLHSGIDLLLGSEWRTSLFVQAGFASLPLSSYNSKIEISDESLFLLLEPRFRLNNSRLHVSLFNIPEEQIKKTDFADGTMGLSINIFTDSLFFRNKNIKFGFNLSFSYEDRYLMDLSEFDDFFADSCSVQATPYFGFPVFSGNLTMMFQAKVSEFPSGHLSKNINFTLGYKSYF